MTEKGMDWQPIETAPKDGTRLLLWQDGFPYTAAWRVESAIGPLWCTMDGHMLLRPTHWLPLPGAPTEGDGTARMSGSERDPREAVLQEWRDRLAAQFTGIARGMAPSIADTLEALDATDPLRKPGGEESVRCICEWAHPVDGSVDSGWPAELNPRCPVHALERKVVGYGILDTGQDPPRLSFSTTLGDALVRVHPSPNNLLKVVPLYAGDPVREEAP